MFLRCLGQNHPGGISANMASDAGQNINAAARMNVNAKLAGANFNRGINRKRKRRTAQFNRVNAKQQVVHHRIADKHNLQNILIGQASLFRGTRNQGLQPLNDSGCHLAVATGIHDPIGNTAHQILAKADLWIHCTG